MKGIGQMDGCVQQKVDEFGHARGSEHFSFSFLASRYLRIL